MVQMVELHLANIALQGIAVDWKLHDFVADLTCHYDYGCDFADGTCIAVRLKTEKAYGEMACCRGCAHFFGYFDYINPDMIDYYRQRYDYRLGFWRPGIGCILPRFHRSFKCNKYTCPVANLNAGILVRKLYQHYDLNRFKVVEHFNWNARYKEKFLTG